MHATQIMRVIRIPSATPMGRKPSMLTSAQGFERDFGCVVSGLLDAQG